MSGEPYILQLLAQVGLQRVNRVQGLEGSVRRKAKSCRRCLITNQCCDVFMWRERPQELEHL